MKKSISIVLAVVFSIGLMSFMDVDKKNDKAEINLQSEWSEWNQTSCLSGLDFRVKRGDYNEYAKKYKWFVEYKNRYTETIHFGSHAVPYSQKNEILSSKKVSIRKHLKPGDVTSTYFLVDENSTIYVYVGKIRMGEKDYGDYSRCDK